MMSNFPVLWSRLEGAVRERPLSPLLRPLVGEAYEAIIARPYDVPRIAAAIERLLTFLASPQGRTSAHCIAVDHFFCFGDDWQGDWEDEPAELTDILADIGGALHDTVAAPKVAANFDSTPEQLLERIRAFRRRGVAA